MWGGDRKGPIRGPIFISGQKGTILGGDNKRGVFKVVTNTSRLCLQLLSLPRTCTRDDLFAMRAALMPYTAKSYIVTAPAQGMFRCSYPSPTSFAVAMNCCCVKSAYRPDCIG